MIPGGGWKANYATSQHKSDILYIQLDVVCWAPNKNGKIVGFVTFSFGNRSGELEEASDVVIIGKNDKCHFAGYSNGTNPPLEDFPFPGKEFCPPNRSYVWDWKTGKSIPMDDQIETWWETHEELIRQGFKKV
jgi:hypothetical protein